jgi:hypothetical protein
MNGRRGLDNGNVDMDSPESVTSSMPAEMLR